MKIVTIIGNRPHFIKSSLISKCLAQTDVKEITVHTGQHYDNNLSGIFFKEFKLKNPNYKIKNTSFNQGHQTGIMMTGIEGILLKEKPDYVIVYGDTNSTLAGALSAIKLHVPIIHIESGLRSYNKNMPEEINRICTDHMSHALLCPTKNSVKNLKKEGLQGIFTGDITYDIFKSHESFIMSKNANKGNYYFCTIHREENTNQKRLKIIFEMLEVLDHKIIFPVHPRTKKYLNFKLPKIIDIIEPLSYKDTLVHIKDSVKVITDSGGIQREAYYLKKPCITLRQQTEYPETHVGNWNILAKNSQEFFDAVRNMKFSKHREYFGDGKAYEKIIKIILSLK